MSNTIRVRFAPSPTGPLHIGGVRTALYNYLFAKRYNGKFILRIEDTDDKRFVSNSESYILETLKWCKIIPDEGVGYGGPHTPYYQSKRGNIYKLYIDKLLKKGEAYYAFDTYNDLCTRKIEYAKKGLVFSYDHKTRMYLNNSLNMKEKELYHKLSSCYPYVIRYRVNPGQTLKINDIIYGDIKMSTDYLDDKILLKSNGKATYHLANTIDDYLMGITHILRGEEWISSVLFHVLLYKSFGWKIPFFAHLPLILKKNSKLKISKRTINNSDFPIYPIKWISYEENKIIDGYRELGYFSEAFVNILALLGWNPGGNKEILSMKELEKSFSLKRIKKSNVFFDIKKAEWLNKQYIYSKKKEVYFFVKKLLNKRCLSFSTFYLWKVINLIINRISFMNEGIWNDIFYFFVSPNFYTKKSFLYKISFERSIFYLKEINYSLNNYIFLYNKLKKNFISQYKDKNKRIIFMKLIRLALVGSLKGVDLFIILEMLGKKESIRRIKVLINNIKEKKFL